MKKLKRVVILSFASLIILYASVGQILFSFASLTPTRTIAASGIIMENALYDIRKSIQAWGNLYTSQVEHLATFDLVNAGRDQGEVIFLVKEANPNVTILGYIDFIGSGAGNPESWYMHTSDGSRLRHEPPWEWYLMDIRSSGWRDHVVDECLDFLSNYPYDGVFADDVWTNLSPSFDGTPAEGYDWWNSGSPYTRWQTYMREFLGYVKSKIGDKLLIYNGYSKNYLDVSDGQMLEHFVFVETSWHQPIDDINQLEEVSATNKLVLACPHNMPEDTKQEFMYGFSCFLLGVNGPNAYFSWRNVWSSSKGYYSEIDDAEVLGDPVDEYYSYQNVLCRDFENGKVLVNLSTLSYTVDLGSEYETLDGQTISNVTLDPNSGVILLSP